MVTRRQVLPWLTVVITVVAAGVELHLQGRQWLSAGGLQLWVPRARGVYTSQHLFDPYSLTHLEHGVILCGLLAWWAGRLPWPWRCWTAVAVESAWEVVENTNAVIGRYRHTGAMGYLGDTVINSLGDVGMCALGFGLAWYLGVRRSTGLCVLIEAVLVAWIRDGVLLSLLTLIVPVDAIAQWQAGGP